LTADEGAVDAVQVAQPQTVAPPLQEGVVARDAGVRQADVAVRGAADDDLRLLVEEGVQRDGAALLTARGLRFAAAHGCVGRDRSFGVYTTVGVWTWRDATSLSIAPGGSSRMPLALPSS